MERKRKLTRWERRERMRRVIIGALGVLTALALAAVVLTS